MRAATVDDGKVVMDLEQTASNPISPLTPALNGLIGTNPGITFFIPDP